MNLTDQTSDLLLKIQKIIGVLATVCLTLPSVDLSTPPDRSRRSQILIRVKLKSSTRYRYFENKDWQRDRKLCAHCMTLIPPSYSGSKLVDISCDFVINLTGCHPGKVLSINDATHLKTGDVSWSVHFRFHKPIPDS